MIQRVKHRILYDAFLFLKEEPIKGIIYKIESRNYYIFTEDGSSLRCYLRGKFKKKYALKKDKQYTLDIATVGDRIEYEVSDGDSGIITEIYDRDNYISRKAPKIKGSSHRGERLEQIVAANIDRLYVVTSIIHPSFNERTVDRIIVAAESSHVPLSLIINKIDLDEEEDAECWGEFYSELGYKVHLVSAHQKTGIDELKRELEGKISMFWGPSGVGKSSILNSLFPHLNFSVGEISDFTDKGKHTTVTSVMSNVAENTYVIDTPGMREIDPYGIKKEDLSHYYVEFAEYMHDCKFNTCTHLHEPGCAVIQAVEDEQISIERYKSYLNLLETIEEDMIF